MAAADLVELFRSKVENQGNGVKTFWMRFHGKEEDISYSAGVWTADTGFDYWVDETTGNRRTNQAIVVGYEMLNSSGNGTGYFAQTVDYDPRPINQPGRVLATVVWRKWEDFS